MGSEPRARGRKPGVPVSEAAIAVLLIAVTILVFRPLAGHGFVAFDDPDYVVSNEHVRGGLSAAAAAWAFTSFHASNWHPLTWLSHMADVSLFGMAPQAHHLANLGWHVGNTILVFFVVRSLTGARWRSAGVAALFAVHPMHVESVAWISERKDVLSGFFWLLTIGAYLRYVRRPGPGRLPAVALAMGLGLMAKPMLVTVPLILLVLDWWPLGRGKATPGCGTITIDLSPCSRR